MTSWTPTERTIKTPYGNIRYGGQCRDDYRNMVTYDRDGNFVLVLQRPAMQAFLDAQVRYAKRSGWSKQRIQRNMIRLGPHLEVPEGRPIILLPGTNRTCSTQTALYAKDSSRYAKPYITGHTRGLAIDRSNAQPNLPVVDACLAAAGWTRTRPTDEPWHWSAPGVTI